MPGACTLWAIPKPSPTSPNAMPSPLPASPPPTTSALLKPRPATASSSPPLRAPSHLPNARPCIPPSIGDPPVRRPPRQKPKPPPNPVPSPPWHDFRKAMVHLALFLAVDRGFPMCHATRLGNLHHPDGGFSAHIDPAVGGPVRAVDLERNRVYGDRRPTRDGEFHQISVSNCSEPFSIGRKERRVCIARARKEPALGLGHIAEVELRDAIVGSNVCHVRSIGRDRDAGVRPLRTTEMFARGQRQPQPHGPRRYRTVTARHPNRRAHEEAGNNNRGADSISRLDCHTSEFSTNLHS